jgi:LPXTG-site transpeptidase (sortase) family protein
MAIRSTLFWLTILSACALAAGPAGSAAKRTISAIQAKSLWKAALASDRPVAEPGEPALWISIPSIKLEQLALQGVTEENLQKLPCVMAWPDGIDSSLTVILGHRDTHFRALERLTKNSTITITQRNGFTRKYRVKDIDIMAPDSAQEKIHKRMDRDEIVLMTCHPIRYVGPAPKRILFWAVPR